MTRPRRYLAPYTEDVVSGEPKLLREFELRAFLSARKKDHVLLSGCTQPKDSISDQVEFLNRCGLGPIWDNVHFEFSDFPVGTTLEPFSGTSHMLRALAHHHELEIAGPNTYQCEDANNKAVMHRICEQSEQLSALIPYGHVVGLGGLQEKIDDVLSKFGRCVVKDPLSASGMNQLRISEGETWILPEGMQDCREFVVEQYVFNKASAGDVADVSVQLYVSPFFEVEEVAVTSQHIKEDGCHFGNWAPATISVSGKAFLTKSLVIEMMSRAEQIIQVICEKTGYWGPCSLDFKAQLSTGEMYALDPNMRISAPTYAIDALMNLYGEIRPFDMRSFALNIGMTFIELLKHFDGLIFDPESQEGFIPFCHILDNFEEGADKAAFCYGLLTARTTERLISLVDQVEKRKQELIPNKSFKHQKVA